jgi:hypothetical protein
MVSKLETKILKKVKIMRKFLYEGLNQQDIDELQKLQTEAVAKLRNFMQHLQQESHRGTIIVGFNASGDSGMFYIEEEDCNIDSFQDFFESNNYHLDHGEGKEGNFVFDWMSALVTSCVPGYEIDEGATGAVVLDFNDQNPPKIRVNVNKFTDKFDPVTEEYELDEKGDEYDWDF